MTRFYHKIIVWFLFVLLLATFKSEAQFSFTPSTQLVVYQLQNTLSYNSIQINNLSADTLRMKWSLISYDSAGGTYLDFCASGECYLGFPATGSFPKIAPGSFGWAGAHFWTGSILDSSKAKVWVYQDVDFANGDTLDFILYTRNDLSIGDDLQLADKLKIYPNPTIDIIKLQWDIVPDKDVSLTLYNCRGEAVYQATEKEISTEIPVQKLPAGCYYLHIIAGDKSFVKKVAIIK